MQNKYKIVIKNHHKIIYASTIRLILKVTNTDIFQLINFIEDALSKRQKYPCLKTSIGYFGYTIGNMSMYKRNRSHSLDYIDYPHYLGNVGDLMELFMDDFKEWNRVKKWGLKYLFPENRKNKNRKDK